VPYSLSAIKKYWQTFREKIDSRAVRSFSFLFYLAGWFIIYYFLLFSLTHNTAWTWVWISFLGFFWFTLNRKIIDAVHPPIEILLALIVPIYLLTHASLNSIYTGLTVSGTGMATGSGLPGIFTYFLLGILVLLLGLVLIINSTFSTVNPIISANYRNNSGQESLRYKQATLVWYTLIGLIGHQIVFLENIYYLYFFEFVLLLLLLNKTGWLGKLSRYELYACFIIFLIIYFLFPDSSAFQKVKLLDIRHKLTWFSFPLYIHLLIKMYFLALLVKIPIVIIYNHASLARKLSMAGLFQSTFPQLFQFVFLISIFFFFISGWQAETLRGLLLNEIEQTRNGTINPSFTTYRLTLKPGDQTLLCSGYDPCTIYQPFAATGIIALNAVRPSSEENSNRDEYFLYVKGTDSLLTSLDLIRIDTVLVDHLSRKLKVLAGKGLICYPYAPKEWQDFISNLPLLKSASDLRIYPFSFLSKNKYGSVISRVENRTESDPQFQTTGRDTDSGNQKFVIGRIFVPVWKNSESPLSYFAFDIYLAFTPEFWESTLVKIFLILLLLFLILTIFISGRVGKFGEQINKIIIQRFQHLKSGIKEISSGNLDYKFSMEGEDEFVELARHFNQMGDRLKQTIAEAREKDRLDQELQIARQVQLSLLPEKLPHIPGYQIAASFQTAREVGGDFYDVLQLADKRYFFIIGDVSGKGTSAALYMAQVISLLRYSQQFILKPLEIVLHMNQYFATQIKDRQIFITAIVGILDPVENTCYFVRAGHTLPVFIPGDTRKAIEEVPCKGLGLGLTNERKKYEESIQVVSKKLAAQDMLLFYTDGVVEAARPFPGQAEGKMEIFGDKKLKEILAAIRGRPAEQTVAALENELNTFYADHPRIDDHTLLIIQKS
jgi:serine phosphatase RsbU (regulator of sigma subunit)